MKTRISVAVVAILAFVVAGSLSSVWGAPQQDPPKKDRVPEKFQNPNETRIPDLGGPIGELEGTTLRQHMDVISQVDSMMQRMNGLAARTQSYSESFARLAAAHHGADKTEILMMQRMSESMGMMAKEIKTSLQQYKDMLEDETASESGSMKAEVQSFKGILDGIAMDLEEAGKTLATLEGQLGQG